MADTFTTFDEYKVTDASIQWKDATGKVTPGVKMGCTGKLELETEMKTVTKKCEGDEVRHVDIPTKITGTWTGHLPVENLRKVWGLSTDGLKKGVFSYGTKSRQGAGVLAFSVLDLDEVQKMLRAFPNMQFSGGLKWSLENGGEEIAEIEQEFTALKDDNGELFYEALESELDDEDLKNTWLTTFSPDLVKATASADSGETTPTDTTGQA